MKNATSVFCVFSRVRTNGKQGKCSRTCYFCIPWGLQKRLLGSLPKPGTLGLVVTNFALLLRDKMSQNPHAPLLILSPRSRLRGDPYPQSLLSASPFLTAPVPYFRIVRQAEQMINIRLDCHGLPHFLLGRPVLGIEFFFSCVNLRELFTVQQFIERRLRCPVVRQTPICRFAESRRYAHSILFKTAFRSPIHLHPAHPLVRHPGISYPSRFIKGGLSLFQISLRRIVQQLSIL